MEKRKNRNPNTEELEKGFRTAFIDREYNSNLAYRPEFLSNNAAEGKKVLSAIESELLRCDEFAISVAFITNSGIEPFMQTFKELERRNIPGRILTTNYLNFSDPKALRRLSKLQNLEIRMYVTDDESEGFHTKGYLFRKDEMYRVIVGSSNMTLGALTRNREWNTKMVSTEQGEFLTEIRQEFQQLWTSERTRSFEDFIDKYELLYREIQKQKKVATQGKAIDLLGYQLKPNSMQLNFIQNLQKLREEGESRALLISATGTGKTYASAFAMRDAAPGKALFVVHREQIAKQALKSYQRVLGKYKPDGSLIRYGLLSGNEKDYDADYLFSTMQMMSKEDVLEKFRPEEFDFICIDETHRAGAESYQRILEYFKPQFLLGMTASPERTDNFDIFDLYDYNIAYEIRLQQALEENLLCPFHYFGITDLEIDGETFDDESGLRNFVKLVSDERVDYILKQVEYFGYSGDRVKGLVFCSRKDEGEELARKFCQHGYRARMLSGDDSQAVREEVIDRLVSNTREDYLDYVFTVDIFNEGVDIPEVNQVVMLRPTQSPIVFVQQLGRGLRKSDDKEFVVILDFIGNYKNNFMIPIALSGDRSYNKDTMRRYVSEGARVIPGSSTIHFDEISKKRIYQAIDSASTNDLKTLKEAYSNLKQKLGRIPRLKDFYDYGTIDVTKFFDKLGSYHEFLKKYEADYTTEMSAKEEEILQFISRKLAKGKRIDELVVLKGLLENEPRIQQYYKKFMKIRYKTDVQDEVTHSVLRNLTNEFAKNEDQKKFTACVFLKAEEGNYEIASEFHQLLSHPEFRSAVTELVDFGIERSYREYGNRYKDTAFQLYAKYTYEDVCRLLNWEQNLTAQNIGGYFYDKRTKTLPVFINYDKAEDAIAYEDRFVTPNHLIALSKRPRKVNSSDADHIYKRTAEDQDNRIFLFIRKDKNDNEAKEFYFLGEIYAEGDPQPIQMAQSKRDAFEINYRLDRPVRDDIYEYIVEETV